MLGLFRRWLDAAVLQQLVDPLNPLLASPTEEPWSEKQYMVGVGRHFDCMDKKASATVPKAAQDRNHKRG